MRYAVIADGMCVNIVKADAAFAERMGWIPLPDGFGIGDAYGGGRFDHLPPQETQAGNTDPGTDADGDL